MPTFAWKAGPEQYPPNELLDYGVAAERAGFDAIEASDHFNPWSEDGQACFTWTWFGALAVKTSTVRIGPGVTCPILRYHPTVIAQAAATVDAMTNGRAFLCVGTGEALNEYAATGYWPDYTERQARLAEAIQIIRRLWSGEELTFDGMYYQTRKARLFTPPAHPIPLYISTMVPESAAFAGQHGDGLITVGGQKPELYQKLITNFEQAAKQAGKDPKKMPRLIELNVAYTSDEQAAIEAQKKYWAGSFVPALFDRKIYTPKESAKNGKVVGSDTIKQSVLISANADDHVKFGQRHLDLGFDWLVYHCAGPDQKGFLDGYGRDVLPRLRQQSGATGKHQLAGTSA